MKRLFSGALLSAVLLAASFPAAARSPAPPLDAPPPIVSLSPERLLPARQAMLPAAPDNRLGPGDPGFRPSLLPEASNAVPDVLSANYVSDFTVWDTVAYYHTLPDSCPLANQPGAPSAYFEIIGRTPMLGGYHRWLYYREVSCGTTDVLSNLVADAQYVYYVSAAQGGLVRISKEANYLDTPQFMVGGPEISGRGYLTQLGSRLYFLKYRPGNIGSLYYIDKTNFEYNVLVPLACLDPCGKAVVTFDYYYIVSQNDLVRYRTDDLEYYLVEENISGFDATDYTIWFAKGNAIYLHENQYENEYPIHISSEASALTYDPVLGGNYIFFREHRGNLCAPFRCDHKFLMRVAWEGSGDAQELTVYAYDSNILPTNLATATPFFLYAANGVLYRFFQDAAALPSENLWITNMEVTQGIQTVSNVVGLIENRRTFVRVYARSQASAVPGVTAWLYRTDANGNALDVPLEPLNGPNKRLTVNTTSNRDNVDESFLFELPFSWLNGTLYLYAVVNPTRVPLEPNYNDNGFPTTFPLAGFTFRPSPRLATLIVSWGYTRANQNWWPSLPRDIIPTHSYIRRTYPLATTPGLFTDPRPGFRPNLWMVLDDDLDTRVDTSDTTCPTPPADPQLCASAYVNMLMRAMRTAEGVADGVFMYGMITDAAGFFPRGQEGGGAVSSGPVGNPAPRPNFAWDTDTTYGDWYAAHEIGHSLGRAHPNPNSDDPNTPPPAPPGSPPPAPVVEGCGHSRSDPAYPYPNAELSPAGGLVSAFDTGDGDLGLPWRVLPGNVGHDVMSYCNNQWLSDYTYRAIYQRLMGVALTPSTAGAAPQPPAAPEESLIPGTVFSSQPKLAGDFLIVGGFIVEDSGAAGLQVVRRLGEVASLPPITAGDYSLRLLNAGGTVLAAHPFTPEHPEDAAGLLSFYQVLNFVPGTTQVQVMRLADTLVLDSYAISANAPAISSVALVSPPNPVTGSVTLAWQASDADGGPLTFDLYYSRDGGTTFVPIQMGVSGSSAVVDTAGLGGSAAARFKVTASDGANQASALSPAYTMAAKPPTVYILTPEDGVQLEFGQIFNLAAEAFDPQDGSQVSYSWATRVATFASGDRVTVGSIGTGANVITVTATNSYGLSATDTVIVNVGDNLSLAGPTLAVGPTSLAFHAAAGAISSQSAQVSIANSGAGGLSWTASDDANWLSVDAGSGTAPATLTVTADPSGLQAGQTYVATLTISSSAAGSPAVIPVALSIGDVWTPPQATVNIYLPLMGR
jgi:hypothetical protein